MQDWPKISIVVPSYNQGQFVEEMLLSVFDQNYPNLELIIMDGNSTDCTIDIIKKHEKHIAYWESKEDEGQSDAINKGVQRATGDIINWLNTDDLLLPGSLERIANDFKDNPTISMIAYNSIKFGEHMESNEVPRIQESMTPERFLFNFWLMQPSCYFRTDVFKGLGPLNRDLHYCMDTELFLRFFLKRGIENYKRIDHPILKFRVHDDSKTATSHTKFLKERYQIDLGILKAFGLTSALGLFEKVEGVELAQDAVNNNLNKTFVLAEFNQKWGPYKHDPSKLFRDAAEYAGWHNDTKSMASYSLKALLKNPSEPLNWKYLYRSIIPAKNVS